jgi:hypothetical protein
MFTKVPNGYYQSEHWQATRRRVLVYRNFTCAACRTYWGPEKTYLLDCHHTKKAYQELWREKEQDLFLLCNARAPRKCHRKGLYEAREIRRDRTANRWIWIIVGASRLVGRLIRGMIRLLFRFSGSRVSRQSSRLAVYADMPLRPGGGSRPGPHNLPGPSE